MRGVLLVLIVAACDSGNAGGGGGGGGVDGPPSGASAAQQFCVSETNRYRAMVGKPALAESAELEAYATTGAMVDFTSSPHNHFIMTNGGGIAFAENECPVQGNWMIQPGESMNTVVAMCIAAFYAEGPGGGHYDNMMGPYASLGCGIYQQGTGVTIVQDYGN